MLPQLMANTAKFITFITSTNSLEYRDTHTEHFWISKFFFRARNLSHYLKIINMRKASRGKRRLHVNYLK